ncbi:hypothetical protein ON010_g13727 [Phytophthora cinnamomi]|nr:hypothetical protein ON010_g13727 [Phytophthora cinnamomi]
MLQLANPTVVRLTVSANGAAHSWLSSRPGGPATRVSVAVPEVPRATGLPHQSAVPQPKVHPQDRGELLRGGARVEFGYRAQTVGGQVAAGPERGPFHRVWGLLQARAVPARPEHPRLESANGYLFGVMYEPLRAQEAGGLCQQTECSADSDEDRGGQHGLDQGHLGGVLQARPGGQPPTRRPARNQAPAARLQAAQKHDQRAVLTPWQNQKKSLRIVQHLSPVSQLDSAVSSFLLPLQPPAVGSLSLSA